MDLLLRWDELRTQGQDPSVEALCGDCPELADELAERIRVLLALEPPKDSLGSTSLERADRISRSGDPAPAASVGAASSRYRRLRLHAKGGLGEVFVAHDEELNREVALKEIQAQFSHDLSCRSRFVSEAEIAGGLEHPGIVPVYGLGKYDDGRPFYAMRFVKGNSLKQAIEEFHEARNTHRDPGGRSLALRALLRRFIDVCNAVAYAHSRGVLHRDLKPSNVMLGLYGETLVVDWGLAKCFDQSEVSREDDERPLKLSLKDDHAITKTGTVSGTPAFMSPEQAEGRLRELGPATDVYGLGATLFAILTGKVPFEGQSPQVILRKLKEGRLTPPRAISSSVPRPLEAVCLKAMAVRPEYRYVTPQALAEDLERWLADEPVSAWHEPVSARARRLMRRHRVWVLASAATLVIVSLGLAISLVVVGAKNVALDRERRRADANAFYLLQGLTEALKKLANPALNKDPECRESALAALREGEAIYLDVMNSVPTVGSAPTRNEYWIHVALLRTAGGDRTGAIEAYRMALNDAIAFLPGHPGDAEGWTAIGVVRTHLGLELWVQGERREARGQLRLAGADFRRALDADPANAKTQRAAAWFHVFCPDPQIRFVKHATVEGRDRPRFSEGIRPLFTLALAQYRNGDWQAARLTIEESIGKKAAKQGGTTLERLVESRAVIDAYDWFVWSMALARLGNPESARQRFEDAAQWMRRNRYGDFELHLLHDEAASLLGLSSTDISSDRDDVPASVEY
jgi:serine/threonine protein kinase